jgi:hypothetical protein
MLAGRVNVRHGLTVTVGSFVLFGASAIARAGPGMPRLLHDERARAEWTGKVENGGEGGIRTLGTLAGSTVFETAPIDHSGTSPLRGQAPQRGPVDEPRALTDGPGVAKRRTT